MTTSVPALGPSNGFGPSSSFAVRRPVLADRLPKSLVRDVAVVAGVAAFTALMAQVSIRIPGNPVPITGQTFAVLLSAAAVGPLRSLSGQLLYLLVGLAGAPVYADHSHGWSVLHGATGGYFIGFLLASALVGYQARHGVDRRIDTLAGAFLLATALIYVPGVWWLAHSMNVSYTKAISLGAAPFVLGDLLKAVVAGALVPAAWRIVREPNES